MCFMIFSKLIHLGASKRDYYLGCLAAYALLALGISLANTAIHLVIDPAYQARTVINLMDVCRWTENGIFAAALQQACFLLLVMIFLHVLLSMQAHWYGWLTDAVLATVICVFTPHCAAALRAGRIFRPHNAQRQCPGTHRRLPDAERGTGARGALGAEAEDAVGGGAAMIRIKAVDAQNILEVCGLSWGGEGACTSAEGQALCNVLSIAEAKYDPRAAPERHL